MSPIRGSHSLRKESGKTGHGDFKVEAYLESCNSVGTSVLSVWLASNVLFWLS